MATKKPPSKEPLFADLLSSRRARVRSELEARVPPAIPRPRYRCKVCRDTKRVKVKRDIGRTTVCTACATEVNTAPPDAHEDRVTDSLLYPKGFKPER